MNNYDYVWRAISVMKALINNAILDEKLHLT